MNENGSLVKNLYALGSAITVPYANTILEKINDHALHLSVMNGEYPWHLHQNTDELFIVLEGVLKIEFENNRMELLREGDFLVVRAGVKHKTSAQGRSINLTIEKEGEDTIFLNPVNDIPSH